MYSTGTDKIINETNLEGKEKAQNQFLPNDIPRTKLEDKMQTEEDV